MTCMAGECNACTCAADAARLHDFGFLPLEVSVLQRVAVLLLSARQYYSLQDKPFACCVIGTCKLEHFSCSVPVYGYWHN